MGGAISKAFGQMGKEMETSGAQKTLNGLFQNGMQFVNTVLPALGGMFGAIANLGSQKGAVSGLADLITGIANGISGFAQGLKPYIPDFDQIFKALGKVATAAGPALAQILGQIAQFLEPIASFLNSKQGQPFVKLLGDIVGGMLTIKGLAKILPGELGKAVGGAPGTILKLVGKPLKGMLSSAFKSAFGTAAKDGEKAAADELENNGGGWLSGLGGVLKSKLSPIFKGAFGSAAGDGAEAAEGAVEGGGALAEGGGLAGMLGGIAGVAGPIALAVGAVVGLGLAAYELYEHWGTVWGGIKKIAKDAWDFVWDGFGKYLLPLLGPGGAIVLGVIEVYQHWNTIWGAVKTAFNDAVHGIATAAQWLYDNGIKPLWNNIHGVFTDIQTDALWLWHDVFDPVWHGIENGASDFVGAFRTAWDKLESVFKAPVNFLIKTVYDDGIAKLWNDVVGAVNLGSLKLPIIPGLAHGGMVPGTDHGRDEVLIAARPEEGVLVPGAVRAIGGAPAIDALNSAHGGGGTGKAGHYSLGGIVSSFIGGAEGTAKAVAALATGNTTAFVNALSGVIGTSAAGSLGKVMVALPKTLVTDAAKAAMGMLGGGAGTVKPSGSVASWFTAGTKAAGVSASWIPDLETIAQHESSDNPNAINTTDSNAAAGDPSRGLMQLIGTTFAQYHAPGTSMNIFDPIANIGAGSRYIGARYGNPGNVPGIISLNSGGPYVGYDSGGVLPPGMTVAVNQTGKPEAVLTAEQSQALSQMAAGNGAQPPAAPQVNVNYYGPQEPSPEQKAIMLRELSLLLA
jgi:hypothetical protein